MTRALSRSPSSVSLSLSLSLSLFLVAAFLAGSGCVPDGEVIGDELAEIRGGRPRDDHPEIARLWMRSVRNRERLGYCTATLIDRRVAITAAHCVNLGSAAGPGDYGFLEIYRLEWSDINLRNELKTYRYQVDAFKSIGPFPNIVIPSTDDIALVRLKKPVPCNVARPAPMSKNGPPAGTVVSRWGFGQCNEEHSRKRVRHLRRGQTVYTICHGDSGGPTMDPNGAVFQVNSGWTATPHKDVVGILAHHWGLIQDQVRRWSAGGCR